MTGPGQVAVLGVAVDRHPSLASWQAAVDPATEDARHLVRLQAGALLAQPPRLLTGHCTACRDHARFAGPPDGQPADLREGLPCSGCGLSARVRAGFLLLDEARPGARDVYLTEQATLAFVHAQRRHPGARGSEFVDDPVRRSHLTTWLEAQGGRGPVVFEDVTALTLEDASVDAVLSFEVLEHVPDYPAALRELARVLRPGGVLVLTAPFLVGAQETLVRARRTPSGEVEHLEPVEVHGDPMSGGVLCWYHFGWDLLDAVRATGLEAEMVRVWQPSVGLPQPLWLLEARRPG